MSGPGTGPSSPAAEGPGQRAPLRTPLSHVHEAMGARMIEFAGWWMPVQYTGIVQEHLAVRQAAGIFDLSHMGELLVAGPRSAEDLQRLVSCRVDDMAEGQARYGVLCLPSGGVLDDLVILRLATDRWLLVVNAACREKDLAWLQQHLAGSSTTVEDLTDAYALVAVQGPRAQELLQPLVEGLELDPLGFYRFALGRVAGREAIISRTGYTGEDGFEIFVAPQGAEGLWEALLERARPVSGLPAGLGARDTLRLEARYPLYGNDIDETTTPLEAGLGWVVDLEKGDFVGRHALAQQRERGVLRRLVGFVLEERAVPRHGYPIVDEEGRPLGEVTSGTLSPVRQQPIGLGYVPVARAAPDSRLAVEIRGRAVSGRVVRGPFVPIRTRGRAAPKAGS